MGDLVPTRLALRRSLGASNTTRWKTCCRVRPSRLRIGAVSTRTAPHDVMAGCVQLKSLPNPPLNASIVSRTAREGSSGRSTTRLVVGLDQRSAGGSTLKAGVATWRARPSDVSPWIDRVRQRDQDQWRRMGERIRTRRTRGLPRGMASSREERATGSPSNRREAHSRAWCPTAIPVARVALLCVLRWFRRPALSRRRWVERGSIPRHDLRGVFRAGLGCRLTPPLQQTGASVAPRAPSCVRR